MSQYLLRISVMKLSFWLILPLSAGLVFAEKLKCFECSEKISQDSKKCSVNQTRYSEANEETGNNSGPSLAWVLNNPYFLNPDGS